MGKALYCGCCGTEQETNAEYEFIEWNEDFQDYLCPECELEWEDYNDM